MEWTEIDLDTAEWNLPAEKMKTREAHLVPLARQAVDTLKEIQPLTGAGRYVFPSPRTAKRPMSNNGVLSALRRMGFEKDEMTGHGFRALARTILDEVSAGTAAPDRAPACPQGEGPTWKGLQPYKASAGAPQDDADVG